MLIDLCRASFVRLFERISAPICAGASPALRFRPDEVLVAAGGTLIKIAL